MNGDDLHALADMSRTLRENGVTTVADHLDMQISAELEGRVLEAELERDLAEHHKRLQTGEGDPFRGSRQ